jgi:2,3-diketo-5-methylthio-1-phosphopentane phosphatase
MNTPTLFLDFDGTITVNDATDAILEAHADPHWLDIEEAWQTGRIGSRACLRTQIALVKATRAEIDAVLDAVEVDEGFVPLLESCIARNVRLHIVSDGFDYCIRRILTRPSLGLERRLEDVRIVSSHLELIDTHWRATFPGDVECSHGCATCKPAAMSRLTPPGSPIVFAGDGLSDRYAAEAGDFVFAKNGLSLYCHEHSIRHTPYATLTTVVQWLEEHIASGTALPRPAV